MPCLEKMAPYKWGASVLALLVTWQAVAAGWQATRNPVGNHTPLYWAELLVREVKPADTIYRHQDSVVTWSRRDTDDLRQKPDDLQYLRSDRDK
jgi:hypothetical protein